MNIVGPTKRFIVSSTGGAGVQGAERDIHGDLARPGDRRLFGQDRRAAEGIFVGDLALPALPSHGPRPAEHR
ncbi:MAG TPA: hypothetical protein VNE42_07475 [Acidimicrobiales bacterium]|nr:hypothetical protein [Acidimicrobiales bacterium]